MSIQLPTDIRSVKPARRATSRPVLSALAALLIGATALTGVTGYMSTTTPARAEAVLNRAPAQGFGDLVEKVMPAVISVKVKYAPAASRRESFNFSPQGSPRDFFEQFGRRFGSPEGRPRRHRGLGAQGSGFIISADGYAVTNNHVVKGASEVTIKTSDGREYNATVIGTDRRTDLALLKIKSKDTFQYVKFAEEDPRVGDWVIAVGNPFGLGGSVTTGIVSAKGRNIGKGPYNNFLQIDASINKGNSGGPAFNLAGDVIGVNTAIYSPSGGSVGIGFAIPASTTKRIIEDLRDNGRVTRGWLGVQIQPVTADIAETLGLPAARGAIVANVTRSSPAGKGGIRTGDTIVEVDGKTVKGPRDLALKIAAIRPGDKMPVTVYRGGKKQVLEITIGTMPDNPRLASRGGLHKGDDQAKRPRRPSLGMRLVPSEDGIGVLVGAVRPGSAAAKKGVRRGDVILEIAGIEVNDPREVRSAMDRVVKEGQKSVLMLLRSRNRQRFVALNIGPARR